MELAQEIDQKHPKFDWIGLAALLIGIDGPIRLLAAFWIYGPLLKGLLLACVLILVGFVRRYNWKNILAALLLIGTLHPVRFIFYWWLNPFLYGVATLVCPLLLSRTARRYDWKNGVTALLFVCTLLSG